jgi:hypothetical protein
MSPKKHQPATAPEVVREKLSIYLETELAQEVRIAAVRQRKTISMIVEDFVRAGFAAQASTGKKS